MTIYAVDPNDEYAEIITRWSVFEVKCGWSDERTRHLVGYIPSMRDGRTSSPIQIFDRDKMQITTRSGRIYQLEGCPGCNSDSDYVWSRYKKINDITDVVDVTEQYYTFKPRHTIGNTNLTRKDLEEMVPISNREIKLLDIPEPYATEFSKYCTGRAAPAGIGKYWVADWCRWLSGRFKQEDRH